MSGFGPIEKLSAAHDLSHFDCGKAELNRFLQRHALAGQKANGAQTYVACREGIVVGYCSLTVGGVGHAEATERVNKAMRRYPIPVMILFRLGVDKGLQGQGVGKGLLKDALIRTARAAEIASIRTLLVYAKDDQARAFYERYGFEPSATDPYHLFLLIKDVQQLVGTPATE